MRDTKKEELRRVLSKAHHPIEKWIRIGLGPIRAEGIPRGRYRELTKAELEALRKTASPVRKAKTPSRST
jgi:23S rRNA pseudouridine2605 synthase